MAKLRHCDALAFGATVGRGPFAGDPTGVTGSRGRVGGTIMRVLRRWTTASITTLLLQVTAIGSFLVFLLLQLTGCTVLFTFTPLTVAPKEEVRLPPPATVPLFTDPAIHAGVPGGRDRFAAALAARDCSRVVATNRNVELAIGVPGAAGGAGKVVRILKNAAGAQSVDEILADVFPVLGDKS